MKQLVILYAMFVMLAAGAATAANAEESAPGEDTMFVLEEGATPADIVDVIELPPAAPPAALEPSERGRKEAGEATGNRDRGPNAGADSAAQARQLGFRGAA